MDRANNGRLADGPPSEPGYPWIRALNPAFRRRAAIQRIDAPGIQIPCSRSTRSMEAWLKTEYLVRIGQLPIIATAIRILHESGAIKQPHTRSGKARSATLSRFGHIMIPHSPFPDTRIGRSPSSIDGP
jgi:hypothetical protein